MTNLSDDQARHFRAWIAENKTTYEEHCLSRAMTGLDLLDADADAKGDTDAAGAVNAPSESTCDHSAHRGAGGGDAASVEGYSGPSIQQVPLPTQVWTALPGICHRAWCELYDGSFHLVATLLRDVEFSNTALDPSGEDPTPKIRLPTFLAWTYADGMLRSCAYPSPDEAMEWTVRSSSDANGQTGQETTPEPWSPDLLALHAFKGHDGQWVTCDAASVTELFRQTRAGSEFWTTSADSNATMVE